VSIARARLGHRVSGVKNETMPVFRAGLDALFLPNSVAVIGATERPGTVGRTVLENLRHPSFQGKVYAVNSRHAEVCGLKAYPSIGAVPDPVDLAVVATPAITVPHIISECVDAGVKSAVVISAGFRERGAEGVELERQIQEQLHRGAMRLIGPNCLGIMNPTIGLNATFAKDAPRPGNVAFLSQSGAAYGPVWNPPYWSLCYEVWYYALFGAAVYLPPARRMLWLVLLAAIAGPRILLLLPVWLAGVWLAWATVLSDHSFWRIAQLKREIAQAERETRELKKSTETLEAQLQDPYERRFRAEEIARTDHGWAAPGEIVYRFRNEKAQGDTAR